MRWILLAAALLVGCPPASKANPDAGAACVKIGDSCTYSPGKLGTCVWKDDCSGANGATGCFVCQSQH